MAETKPDIVTGSDGKEHDLAKVKIPQWLRDYIGELRDERDEAMGVAEEKLAGDDWREALASLWDLTGSRRMSRYMSPQGTDADLAAGDRAWRAGKNIRWAGQDALL